MQFNFFIEIKYIRTEFNQHNRNCGSRKRNIQNRRCFRPCMTDLDCRGSKRKCLCDGDCGLSCIRKSKNYIPKVSAILQFKYMIFLETSCSQVVEFLNGFVNYNPDNMFGSQLTYSCNQGYTLIGNKVRICEGDGWWSGNSPICVKEGYNGCFLLIKIINLIYLSIFKLLSFLRSAP